MTTWQNAQDAAPELAKAVQERFESTGLGFLATLRPDGSPRISGVEPSFWNGEVWLGMMLDSKKALDLRRDPRFALHAASVDKKVEEGDARISGRAIEIDDGATKEAVSQRFGEQTDFDPETMGPYHLFKADVTEVYFLKPAGDHLDIQWWTPDRGSRRVDRY